DGFYFKPVLDLLSQQLLRDLETDKVNAATKEWKEQNLIYIPPEKLFFSGLHQCIFTLPQSVAAYPGYFLNLLRQLYTQVTRQPENTILKETIYATYLALEKLESVMERHLRNGVYDISPAIFFRLMMQYLNKVAVPFEGEPLSGIQVMGILETRCLDFERLIIIGLNEDEWPKGDAAPSMIPYSMRKAFGLPGIDDQDAMYSYYFYRLIQRTEEVTATWNSVREALSGGELSRLGFQLELHSPHQVVKRNFDYPLMKNNWTPLTAVSSETTARRLLDYNHKEKPLSPSAIVAFLHCRMKFYLSYVVGLREEEEVKEDIDRMVFGNIFHKAMETLYLPFTGKIMQEADFSVLLNDKGR
ncbi:MAG TPA: PD-(D/E)XK nuclease family protein, partial [Prolixibacteraceae bacterium]|nr:PD-(D/E)XK nuclease family protein [Prolixibacteraceae bacterium]